MLSYHILEHQPTINVFSSYEILAILIVQENFLIFAFKLTNPDWTWRVVWPLLDQTHMENVHTLEGPKVQSLGNDVQCSENQSSVWSLALFCTLIEFNV